MADNKISQVTVLNALADVQDPAINRSLVSATLIRDIQILDDQVSLTVVLIAPGHPFKDQIEAAVRTALENLAGITKVDINFVTEIPSDGRQRGPGPGLIRSAIAVASGKGGVGKSTVSVNLAIALAQSGAKVGLMDADVYGPNIPMMMGVEHLPAVEAGSTRLVPAEAHGVKLMSIGFMVKREQAIVWRGPMLHSAIRQFVEDVEWGELDYLIIDLPPGTGDAQLSLAQVLPLSGGVIVTLPQEVSLEDARRGLEMFRQLQVPLLGVVENMSYLELPDGQKMDVFGSGGGEKLALEAGLPFIGAIPMDPRVRQGGDNGQPIIVADPQAPAAIMLRQIAEDVALKTAVSALQRAQTIPITMIN
ncbi:MAG: Mrp/NBP35 family ATP-binding protein [Anaerolineae bacterium]|nr:Mrp/NBP35 family ATP-binding protein [Anaerolineae bacterium]